MKRKEAINYVGFASTRTYTLSHCIEEKLCRSFLPQFGYLNLAIQCLEHPYNGEKNFIVVKFTTFENLSD